MQTRANVVRDQLFQPLRWHHTRIHAFIYLAANTLFAFSYADDDYSPFSVGKCRNILSQLFDNQVPILTKKSRCLEIESQRFVKPGQLLEILLRVNLVFHKKSVLHPTLPSRLTPSSFCASTANSIGSSRKTSLQKPLTIMFTASCVERPRALQ